VVRINRDYLDPALSSIKEHNSSLLDRSLSERDAVRAAAQAVSDKARSELVFKTNLSRGIMIALILVGLGILIALAIKPLSQIFNDQGAATPTGIWGTRAAQPEISDGAQPDAITQSVTLFRSTAYNDTGNPFAEITAGHKFNSVYDEIWSAAFCYTYVQDGVDHVRIDLSQFDSPTAQMQLFNYVANDRFNINDYTRAQGMCPYQREDF